MSQEKKWALILGASSGFGEATAIALARAGRNIFGVHLDRKATLPNVDRISSAIGEAGGKARFFNINAADQERRTETMEAIAQLLAAEGNHPGGIDVLLHSLAFGTLKPFLADASADRIAPHQMEMTLDVMASSLVFWAQELITRSLMGEGGHIFAMTSAGGHRIWPAYGAVSAAKAALESNCRQLAVELVPRRIAVNAVRAGVTDTPALRKIPGNDRMIEHCLAIHPARRLTVPADVAAVIAAIARPETVWMTGNVLGVDGTEDLIG